MVNYQLHHGDCLEIMTTLEAGSVDAIITDIPYGTTACAWDSVIPLTWYIQEGKKTLYRRDFLDPDRYKTPQKLTEAWEYWEHHKQAGMWQAIKHVIKPRGAVVLFGSEPFSSHLRMSNEAWYKYDWVWRKSLITGFLDSKRRPLLDNENIVIFASGQTLYNPQMVDGKPHKNGTSTRENWPSHYGEFHATTTTTTTKYYPKRIIHFSNPRVRGQHPTQKPVGLMEYLIKTYTNEGETVLDFTMGSGTTGVACARTKRNFIGIELDDTYFGLASDRIAEAYAETPPPKKLGSGKVQLSLFGE